MVDEWCERLGDVLAVVEHQQGASRCKVLGEGCLDRAVLALLNVEGLRDHLCRAGRVAQGSKLHNHHTVVEVVHDGGCHAQRESGLTHTAGTGDGDERLLIDCFGQGSHIRVATDERRGSLQRPGPAK